MSTNRVDETAAGKKIAAYIVTDKKGKRVGMIRAYHAGVCLVNVWSWTDPDNSQYGEARAGGGGYDRFTAALARTGITFGKFPIFDHCHQDETTRKAMRDYQNIKGHFTQ